MKQEEWETQMSCLVMQRDIAHTLLHRMSLWHYVFRGGSMRKMYDDACEGISRLHKDEPK